MVEALVLAGSLNDGGLREVSNEPYEALVPVAGRPMVDYVLQALQESPSISRITVVGPTALASGRYDKVDSVVESTVGVMDNLKRGLDRLGGEGHVLLTTSDIPLLTVEAVEDFIQRCQAYDDGELFYSIVAKEVNEGEFAGVKRTYIKLQDGVFTGGNLFYFHTGIVEQCWSFVEEMVALRKEPLRMSARLGWLFILRLVLGQLTITSLERRVGSLLGIKARAVPSPYPGVGIDVDKVADYELVNRVLGQ